MKQSITLIDTYNILNKNKRFNLTWYTHPRQKIQAKRISFNRRNPLPKLFPRKQKNSLLVKRSRRPKYLKKKSSPKNPTKIREEVRAKITIVT